MEIKKEVSFEELVRGSWSGAVDTLETVMEHGKEDELMDLMEEVFQETPTETEVNDFLWFDTEYIFDVLGIEEEE